MESGIGFVAVAGAIFVSYAVALGLEWLSLVLLMSVDAGAAGAADSGAADGGGGAIAWWRRVGAAGGVGFKAKAGAQPGVPA